MSPSTAFILLVFFYPLQIEELTSSLPALQAIYNSTSSLDSSTSSTETTSPPVKRKPPPPLQGGARKALLRWVQHNATKYRTLNHKLNKSGRHIRFYSLVITYLLHILMFCFFQTSGNYSKGLWPQLADRVSILCSYTCPSAQHC